MKTVAFYQPFMNERGTCVAMYNYAHFNETLLSNKSIFIYDSLDSRNESMGLQMIRDRFPLYDIKCADHPYDNYRTRVEELDKILDGVDYFYVVKSGYNDGVIPTKAKVLVHVVGMIDPKEAHGDVWAYCSKFSSDVCSAGSKPFVPYMVNLPENQENLRDQLGLNGYTVIGRYGGIDTFDIWWVKNVIKDVLDNRDDIFFLFLNTPQFIDHNRVRFLDRIVDLNDKVKYINTIDCLLHARAVGETFGMVCAEVSSKNKPVMTLSTSPERNHIDILGDKGLYYKDYNSLYDLLINFKPSNNTWNAYEEYTPEKVMDIFNKVFLI